MKDKNGSVLAVGDYAYWTDSSDMDYCKVTDFDGPRRWPIHAVCLVKEPGAVCFLMEEEIVKVSEHDVFMALLSGSVAF